MCRRALGLGLVVVFSLLSTGCCWGRPWGCWHHHCCAPLPEATLCSLAH